MSEVCCSCLGTVWNTLEGKLAKRLTKKHGCSNCRKKAVLGPAPKVVTNSNSNVGNKNSIMGNKDSTVGNTNSNVGNSNAAVDNSKTIVDNSHTTVNNYPVKVSLKWIFAIELFSIKAANQELKKEKRECKEAEHSKLHTVQEVIQEVSPNCTDRIKFPLEAPEYIKRDN